MAREDTGMVEEFVSMSALKPDTFGFKQKVKGFYGQMGPSSGLFFFETIAQEKLR